MAQLSQKSQISQASATAPAQSPGLIMPAIAFFAPFVLSVYFTFIANNFNRGLVWDSAHYVLSAQSLLNWLSEAWRHNYVSPASIDLGPSIMVDGPILPAFGAILIGLGGIFHVPAEVAILIGQSLVCGLSSLLLYWLACRLIERKPALAGALFFGLNPATIVSASQFLTEQLTVTTLLAFSLMLVMALPRGRLRNGRPTTILQSIAWFWLGSLSCAVLHLKTALFPTAAIVILLSIHARGGSWRSKSKIFLALSLGFIIALVPWLIFSKLASGRMSLGPNRVPSINLAVGMDLESDAWGVAPPTESVLPIIFDKPAAIVVSLWQANRAALTSLFLRKIERLLAYSWNDFGWPFLGLDSYWQSFLQRLLLAGAMLGLIYLLLEEKLFNNTLPQINNRNFLKLTVLLMVAGHFVFIPFETQPRYGFSALPFLVLLALIAASHLARQQKFPWHYGACCLLFILLAAADQSGPLFALTGSIEDALLIKNILLALLFGLAITFCFVHCRGLDHTFKRETAITACAAFLALAFLTVKSMNLPPPEWHCVLTPQSRAERQIFLPPTLGAQWLANEQSTTTWAAALIDGDQNIDTATIAINGQPASGAPQAMLDVEQDYNFQATIKDLAKMAAQTRGVSANQLRQWRVVPLPLAAVNLDGRPNILSVTAGQVPVKVYGQYRFKGPADRKLWLPSLYGFSALRLSVLGDPRTCDILRPRTAASNSLYNFTVMKDLSPEKAGDQTGDYRIYMMLGCSSSGHKEQTSAVTFKNFFAEVF